MKGILFNSLEVYLKEKIGEEKLLVLIEHRDFKTKDPFVAPLTYPDEDFTTLITKAADALKQDIPDFLRGFGRFSFHFLANRHPNLMKLFGNAKDFLKNLDVTHQDEIIKFYPDSDFPRFEWDESVSNQLVLHYRSQRKLCLYIEGILVGMAEYYNETIKYRQTVCALKGAEECCFELSFSTSRKV